MEANRWHSGSVGAPARRLVQSAGEFSNFRSVSTLHSHGGKKARFGVWDGRDFSGGQQASAQNGLEILTCGFPRGELPRLTPKAESVSGVTPLWSQLPIYSAQG